MNRWIGFFLPQVQFWARGGRFEVFLSRCLEQGVPLSGVRPAPGALPPGCRPGIIPGFTARPAAAVPCCGYRNGGGRRFLSDD